MNQDFDRSRYSLLLLIFVMSGFAGLIYQSIWSHYLGLFLGHAAYAQSLVLALFMGGMALGATLVSRFGHRWGNLIRMYALAELVIGVFGLGFHWVFLSLLGLSYEVIMPALGEPILVNGWKWLLAAALILPQTVLLGMTFPLMSGGIIRRWPDRDGRALGGLYFTNSIGAAFGVLVAAFLLLPYFGMPGAMVCAGALNLLVAGLAWSLGRGTERPRPGAAGRKEHRAPGSRGLLYLVLGATFFSSAASFAYEISFVRMLSLAVGSTLHAFELMLASFIAGIALGALWIRRHADTARSPMRLVAVLQVFMGLAALLALAVYSASFAWVGFLMDSLARTDGGYGLFNLGTAVISIMVMIPTAFFAGTTLPLFTVALLRDGQGEGSIGRVYAFNTVGAIIGVFAAVHLLIPLLGVKLALICAAMVDIAIGVVILRRFAERRRDFLGVGVSVAVMISAMWVAVNVVPFDPMKLSAGVYRTGDVRLDSAQELLFYRDGKTASVSVVSSPDGTISLATNGKADASMQTRSGATPTEDEPTMILLGALPLAYVSDPKLAAVIGFGSGMTTHTLLASASLERVDSIEIERQMVEAAEWFGERVQRSFEDERSNIVIDDAKSFFAGHQGRYDIIVSEPSNPWISGVGALFASEFYEFIPRYLEDGGVFVQWLQLYEIDNQLVGSVLNAILPQFADVHGYLTNGGDLVLIASQQALEHNPDFEDLVSGSLGAELQHVGIEGGKQVDFRRVADRDLLEALARLYRHRPNSYYYPVLSLEAPRTRFRQMIPLQLVSLPHLDVPVLEWLGVRKPPGLAMDLPGFGHFPADEAANDARAMIQTIRDPGSDAVNELELDLRHWVLELGSAARICETQPTGVAGEWLVRRIKLLAELTIPYVDPAGLEGILIDPVWLDCKTLPPGIEWAMSLVEANARRDAEAMVEEGRDWLEKMDDHPEYLNALNEVAFASLQLGLIGQERHQEALSVEDEFGSRVRPGGDYGFVRSLLLAYFDEDE